MSDRTLNSPLAIVGISCLFPKADGLDAFWANIKEKVDCIEPVPSTHWNPADYFDSDPKRPDFTYARRGGFLSPYPFSPAEFGIAPRDLEAIDTAQLLGLVVAKMALEDAGLLTDGVDRKRISVVLGVTSTLEMVVPLGARLGHPLWRKALVEAGVSDSQTEHVIRSIGDGYVEWQENSFPGLLGNVVAGRIANRLDLGGTNCVVDAACASSLSALHLAAMELTSGRADAVLTGGVDTFNDIFMYMCFSKTPALSPTGDARPFSVDADGTILGEGLGMLVLKRLADAEKAGDRIYAILRGIGTSSDGIGNAVYAPSAEGQIRCLRDAYKQAAVAEETVELIEAHGTGTKVGDAAELDALNQLLAKSRRRSCAVGSIKSQIGHTKAAAGAAGLIKAAMALHHRTIPPTIKVDQPAEEVTDSKSPLYVNTEPRPWLKRNGHPRRAGVSSFGFGGSNFHCVLEEYPAVQKTPDFDGSTQIFAWSDNDFTALSRSVEAARLLVAQQNNWDDIRRVALSTRRHFDESALHRMLIVVQRGMDLTAIFDEAVSSLQQGNPSSNQNVIFGRGERTKLGLLFPGQGSQHVGMLRQLACAFPVFQDVLQEADRAFSARLVTPSEIRLSDFIYPPAAFTAEERLQQETSLRDTAVAQPALGAVSLAALHILRSFGVTADATAGHSYGELTALCAAGCYDALSLFELSQLRGRLMADTCGDRGAMLAVMAPLETIESVVNDERVGVVVANRNAPGQAVLSGPTVEIEKAERTLKQRKLRHIRLPVAAAFHSPLVADAAEPFRAALEPIDFRAAQLPVFANSTSREYPPDPQAIRDLLAAQLSRPVDFVSQIRNMVESGVKTFLEVGPGHTLTSLVSAILGNEPHQAFALDASAGRQPGLYDLGLTLARLAALGHPVRLTDWDPKVPAPRNPRGPIFPICGANYRSRQPKKAKEQLPEIKVQSAQPTPMAESPRHDENRTQPAPSPDATHLQRALQVAQESLAAFQKLQEQTATLHRVFLEQQSQAQNTLQQLLAGQQQLLAAGLNLPTPSIVLPPPPTPAPISNVVELPTSPPLNFNGQQRPVPTRPPELQSNVSQGSDLTQTLLNIVAEKTGYPLEMLNPDMGLDSDLGIDSIKRVEILSALQEQRPDTPSVPPDRLGSLRTLREVVALLEVRTQSHPISTSPVKNDSKLADELLQIVAEKTGYPIDMLELDMNLDSDLGIDSIKRVEILSAVQDRMPDLPSVAADQLGALRTLRDVVAILDGETSEKKNTRNTVMT